MNKILTVRYVYFLSIYLVMATIFGLSFTWNFTPGVVLTYTAIISLWYFLSSKREQNPKAGSAIFILGLWYFYAILNSGSNIITQLTINSLNFIIVICIVFLGKEDKRRLLDFITRITSIILAISLVAWILFLVNVPLPHSAEMMHDDNFHSYINYYFFLLTPREVFVLPRFLSVFKEPGHLASICVLLILANIKNTKEKRFDIIILSIALILSFSLAGWVVMGMVLLLLSYVKGKKIINIMGVLALFAALFFITASNEDSVVNEYIYNRLEYDESSGIVGNNRTNTCWLN